MAESATAQRVFITGGCGDIGSAIAARFLAGGAKVALADVLTESDGVAKARALHPTDARYVHCDVTSTDSVQAAIDQCVGELGGLDVAICNAGTSANGRMLDLSRESWQTNLDVYFTGAFLVAQRAAKAILRNPRGPGGRRGSLLFTGTWVQQVPWPGAGGYCAAKAGQEMLMKVMAQELAEDGITCNVIAPGLVDAGLTKLEYERNETFRKQIAAAVPLGRMSTAEEVAGAYYFLAGPEAAYITGATLLVDGGATLGRRET